MRKVCPSKVCRIADRRAFKPMDACLLIRECVCWSSLNVIPTRTASLMVRIAWAAGTHFHLFSRCTCFLENWGGALLFLLFLTRAMPCERLWALVETFDFSWCIGVLQRCVVALGENRKVTTRAVSTHTLKDAWIDMNNSCLLTVCRKPCRVAVHHPRSSALLLSLTYSFLRGVLWIFLQKGSLS